MPHLDSYKSIPVECVFPELFPSIALYTKGSGVNFVLYKPSDRPFTQTDQQRLERTGTKNIFIHYDDINCITTYFEKNLSSFLDNSAISDKAKNLILYQTAMEFVAEVLETPESAPSNLTRCKSLIKNLMKHLSSTTSLLQVLKDVASDNLYILSHSVKVAALTMLVHEKAFNICHDEMLDVGVGAILHDIGMTFISNEILEKPEALSNIEYEVVKTHSQKGYDYLNKSGLFSEVSLSIVRHHHEKWDGTGYPAKLRGDNISRSAQVTAVCDIYAALVSDRPYRKASSHADAIRIMESESGRSFNKELFDNFKLIIGAQNV